MIDDESPKVRATCHEALVRLGARALPALREAARTAGAPARRAAARALAGELAFDLALQELRSAQRRGEPLLEHGVCALALLVDPLFERAQLTEALDLHTAMLRARLSPGAPLARCVELLARYVHGDLGIRGNQEHYYDPRNSFVNEVLRRKLGIPISIAAIYLLLARRLGLPLEGFGVPAHFLLGYLADEQRCFVDAFHAGQVLSPRQVEDAAREQGFELEVQAIVPATDTDILVRMTNNLRRILEQEDPRGWKPSVERLRELLLHAEAS
ncbi:MAG: transglutaminase family protein [Planctomycetes bacterium]|nr:transglutaminase family protein [Planctomycetota bacterium]